MNVGNDVPPVSLQAFVALDATYNEGAPLVVGVGVTVGVTFGVDDIVGVCVGVVDGVVVGQAPQLTISNITPSLDIFIV